MGVRTEFNGVEQFGELTKALKPLKGRRGLVSTGSGLQVSRLMVALQVPEIENVQQMKQSTNQSDDEEYQGKNKKKPR